MAALDDLADRYVDAFAAMDPCQAALMGIAGQDARLTAEERRHRTPEPRLRRRTLPSVENMPLSVSSRAREKIFAEKVSTRVRVRPEFENALEACRQIKARAPHCRVILTVYEVKRLGRDSAELTALADHLTAHGIALEMLAGPLTGTYDPSGTGRLLFAFFAAMAEEDMLHTVLRRRARGESVEDIRPDLIIPTGKRKGQSPSPASIYRALAEHDKRQRHPETVEQTHADFTALQAHT